MVEVLIMDHYREEMERMHRYMRNAAAHMSELDWNWVLCSSGGKLKRLLDQDPKVDLACMDVAAEGGITLAEQVRQRNGAAFIMVLADSSISPMHYLKPSIMPGALLLRPFSEEQMRSSLLEVMEKLLDRLTEGESPGMFTLPERSGRRMIPYREICFFEAREKKVFLNTGREEYGLYDTIEHLQEVLPAGFLRCHRSFIVAKSKIHHIYLSKNYLELNNGLTVPLSRSYKNALKELK